MQNYGFFLENQYLVLRMVEKYYLCRALIINTRLMKQLKTIVAICLILLCFHGKAHAQIFSSGPDMKGRVVYGMTLGGGVYNSGHLNISVSPQLGYRIFSPWEVGVRGLYDFSCRFNRVNGNWYGHYLGVSPYTNLQFFRGLFVHAEYEFLYGFSRWQQATVNRSWFTDFFVGGGYRQYSMNGGGYSYIMVLYNLSWDNPQYTDKMYPYASPIIIRVGYCFGK